MNSPTFQRVRTLFGVFCYLSAVTLGGGLAMLPLMQQEFVEKRGWMTKDEMVDTVAAMQSMPGIIAMNMGVLIGYRCAGIPGALAALLGALLPPFIAIVLLAAIVARLRQYAIVQHVFLGIRAAVAAMILLAVVSLGRQILKGDCFRRVFSWCVTIASFVALVFFGADAIWVIVAGAILGLACFGKSTSQTGQEK
ncbi:MAG: chromate transporter [Victivallales bacterium]|nr:chromate transporter [Victivallales bacterium]